jgi:hypothetical protein
MGVEFKFSPGGFQILQAVKTTSKLISHDLTITSGCDGTHSGPNDPHYHGDAYDVRSKDLDPITKQQVLANLNNLLPRDKFYYFLENPNLNNEHFHIQVKNGMSFDIMDWLNV